MGSKELIELEFNLKMQYAEFVRETERLKHEWDKERIELKSNEIRKNKWR